MSWLAATRQRSALWGDAWYEVTHNARSAGASRLTHARASRNVVYALAMTTAVA